MRQIKIRILLVWMFTVSAITLQAQTAVVAPALSNLQKLRNAPWKKEKVTDGVIWQYYHFPDLFGVKQSISVLEVDLTNKKLQPKVAFHDTALLPLSTIASQSGALAAINGNFFHTEEGGSVCFLKVNGKILDTSRTDLTESLFLEQLDDAAFTIDSSGKVAIRTVPAAGWKSLQGTPTILSTGPLLINGGKRVKIIAHSFNDKRYGRSGVGLTADNHLILITADGNTSGAAGMTMHEFSQVFSAFNCVQAVNLDGGGSAAMWIKGKPDKGIVSYPSDNKQFDHKGERKIANALIITWAGSK